MINNHRPIEDLVILGDMHFGFDNNSIEWLENFMKFFDELFLPMLRNKTDDELSKLTIFFTGDVYDKKQVINTYIQNRTIDLVNEIASYAPVYIIIGNHDTPRLSDRDINNCKSLSHIDNVQVYVNSAELKTVAGDTILMMPWVSLKDNQNAEREIINSVSDTCKYLFMHTDLYGCKYETKTADDPTSLRPSDISHFDRVWAGHVHKRHEVGNALFVGSPWHSREVEYANECGYQEVTFHKSGGFTENYINNLVTPRRIRITFDRLMDMEHSKVNQLINGNYINVIISPDDFIRYDTNEIFSLLVGHRNMRFTYKSQVVIADDDVAAQHAIEGLEVRSMEDSIKLYMDNLEHAPISKKEIITVTSGMNDQITELLVSLHKKAI